MNKICWLWQAQSAGSITINGGGRSLIKRCAAILSIVVLLSACSGAPVQEMSDARQAILAAKRAGAETRTPQIYSNAQRYLIAARTALGKGQFVVAKRSALNAKKQAVQARMRSMRTRAIP